MRVMPPSQHGHQQVEARVDYIVSSRLESDSNAAFLCQKDHLGNWVIDAEIFKLVRHFKSSGLYLAHLL